MEVMSECRLQLIKDGATLVPRSCRTCGLFGRCQKGLDSRVPIKPTYEDLQAELDRTKKALGQAIGLATSVNSSFIAVEIESKQRIRHMVRYFDGDDECWDCTNEVEAPELYAHLKEASGE